MSDFSYAHVPWRQNMMGVQIPTLKPTAVGALCGCGCEQPLPAGSKIHRRYIDDRHEKTAKRRQKQVLDMILEYRRAVLAGRDTAWLQCALLALLAEINGVDAMLMAWAEGRKG